MSAGTSTMPPPTPNSPAAIPARAPIKTKLSQDGMSFPLFVTRAADSLPARWGSLAPRHLGLVELGVEVGQLVLEELARVLDGLVVDRRAELANEEVEQPRGI